MVLKSIILIVWVMSAACFFVATDSSAAAMGRLVFWVMLAAHVLEFLVFLPKIRQASGSLGEHLGKTLVFGMIHLSRLRSEAEPTP